MNRTSFAILTCSAVLLVGAAQAVEPVEGDWTFVGKLSAGVNHCKLKEEFAMLDGAVTRIFESSNKNGRFDYMTAFKYQFRGQMQFSKTTQAGEAIDCTEIKRQVHDLIPILAEFLAEFSAN